MVSKILHVLKNFRTINIPYLPNIRQMFFWKNCFEIDSCFIKPEMPKIQAIIKRENVMQMH